ncbi:NUDIX hydrolase [Rhodobacteraceae bacterium CCMM004]|nr:NUDIX hydrolase [Rhodobacteraceae bacterium CCMM004]
MPSPRLAVRGLILHDDRLLLVNAWRDPDCDLWCAPGGGVERGASLPDNLIREVREETGLTVTVGAPALVNEFHDPGGRFHQVDVYFHCTASDATLDPGWTDPEGVVTRRRWVARDELAALRHKPDSLAAAAWGTGGVLYDALEPLLR